MSRAFFSDSASGSPPPPSPASPEDVAKLEKQVSDLSAKLKQAEESLLYSLAEQENIRKRMRKDVDNAKAFGIEKFAKSLFDVADVLKQATARVAEVSGEESPVPKNEVWGLITGVRMTQGNLVKALKEHGVTSFGMVGEEFDPNRHESLAMIPQEHSKHPPGSVGDVFLPGWFLNGRVLRAAQVGVVSGDAKPKPAATLLERELNPEKDEADDLENSKKQS